MFAYDAILALVFFLAMAIIRQEIRYSDGNVYGAMVWLYPILGVTQLVILGVVVPVRTASSISGEKERQTFDIMMTTGMTPFSVILGKVMTAIVQSMFFVVASMPIMALCFTIGGMSWSYLFWFLAVAFLVSFFAASIGILCSSICRKSISAVIMSYGFYLLFFLGTVLPSILYQIFYINLSYSSYYNGWGNTPLFLLLNPFIYLSEFFAQVMVGRSVVSELFGGGMSGAILGQVATGYRWVVVSSVLFVSVSVLFLLAAARRIDPVRNYGGKRKRQKSAG